MKTVCLEGEPKRRDGETEENLVNFLLEGEKKHLSFLAKDQLSFFEIDATLRAYFRSSHLHL